jgi:RNA polymerase sigma-70 factor, ECF subfamily
MPSFTPDPPDGLLIAASLAGEEEAFERLVERYRGPLLKAAVSRLSRPELAEEAVQEAFLAAHRWLSTYDSRYSFRTWLWTILLNQCSRMAKRESRHEAGPGTETSSGRSARREQQEPVCGSASPLDAILARESSDQMRAMLARLPEAQADALRLRFFGGLTYAEIAAAMKCSEPGAKHRVKAGLVTLSKWLLETAERR